VTSDFSSETLEAKRAWNTICRLLRKENQSPSNTLPIIFQGKRYFQICKNSQSLPPTHEKYLKQQKTDAAEQRPYCGGKMNRSGNYDKYRHLLAHLLPPLSPKPKWNW